MIQNTNKHRAVFLAVLMILSVFAGSIAFSGSVAAAPASIDTDNSSITPATVDEGSTNTYSFTLNASELNTSQGSDQIFSVNLPDNFTIDSSSVTAGGVTVNEGGVGVNSTSVDSANSVINVTLNDNAGSDPDTVNISFSADITAPEVSGDTTVNARFGVDYNATGDFSETNDAGYENFQQIAITDSGVGPQSGSPELVSAIHYDNDPSSSTDSEIELAFTEEMDSSTLSNIQPYVDDSAVASSDFNVNQPDKGRVVIQFTDNELRTGDVVVNVPDTVTDTTGNSVSNSGNESVTFAPVTVKTGNEVSAYQGSNVSIISNTVDADVTVEGTGADTDSYFAEGSTGPTSKVYRFSTEERNLGTFDIEVEGTSGTANVTVRDLGFGLTVDDPNVTDDDTIEADVTANAGNRPVELELRDSTGDDINTSSAVDTDGQGELTVEFDTSTADDGDALDPGEYTVRATDLLSGVEADSSEITVSQADDEEAGFANNVITEQRGDILEATVEMTETSEATLTFGSDDDGVVANATVEDDDGDDEVTVYINTYRLDSGVGGDVFSVDSDSDDSVLAENLESGTDDLVDAGDYDLEVQSGEQGVGTGQGVTESDDVATVTLEERSTNTLRTWTGSADELGSISDLEDVNEALEEGQITQSSDVAVGDLAVHQLEASGFEGVLDARENEDVTQAFNDTVRNGPINLTIEEASPGANQDASELNLSYGDNVSVIADGPNDTYFIVVDTGEVDFDAPRDEQLPSDEDTELETNFTVLQDDAGFDFTPDGEFDDDENAETFVDFTAEEPEASVDEPFNVSQASGQTVSGETNIAPGTELTLRVRSQSGVSPSFLKTASPVVQSDGTYSATFDFNEQNIGDEYDIVVANTLLASDEEESGQVVEAVETATPTPTPEADADTPAPDGDTATPEPGDDTATPDGEDTETSMPGTDASTSTPTSTPGFGVVVALTALLAAALLAVRRNN